MVKYFSRLNLKKRVKNNKKESEHNDYALLVNRYKNINNSIIFARKKDRHIYGKSYL